MVKRPKPRIAYFSPLPPVRSGVSDYSAELLPHLVSGADVDVVVAPRQPVPDSRHRPFQVVAPDVFAERRELYDAAVYQVANNLEHHGYMVPWLLGVQDVPGVLVLHDLCLQYLMLGLTLRRGRLRELEAMLQSTHGAEAPRLARRILVGGVDPARMSFAMPLIEASRAVIVHSDFARQRVLSLCPGASVHTVPMGVPLHDPPFSTQREEYGLRDDEFILMSVSTISYTKRIDLVLKALGDVRDRIPRVRFVIVGGGSLGSNTRKLVGRLGLSDRVSSLGWVSRRDYHRLIGLADAVLDLRHSTGSETSASLARALAAGKPAIVSDQGPFLELPESCCVKIPVGFDERQRLGDAIEMLVRDSERRTRMGGAARKYAAANLRLEDTARGYEDVVAGLAQPSPRSRRIGVGERTSLPLRLVVSALYRGFRVAVLCRRYGIVDTVRRLWEFQLDWPRPSV